MVQKMMESPVTECVYVVAACTRKVCGRGGWWPRNLTARVWDKRGVFSELTGTGEGWRNEVGNEWVNGWEGGDIKQASLSPWRHISDPQGWPGKAVAGLWPDMSMGQLPSPPSPSPHPPPRVRLSHRSHPAPSLRSKDCLQLWLLVFPLNLLCNQLDAKVNGWGNSKFPHDLPLPPSVTFQGERLGSCLSFPLAAFWSVMWHHQLLCTGSVLYVLCFWIYDSRWHIYRTTRNPLAKITGTQGSQG